MDNASNNKASQFTVTIKEVISVSREEAIRLENDFIGSEHFVLAMIQQGQNSAIDILKNKKIDLSSLKTEIESTIRNKKSEKNVLTENFPLTKQAEKDIRLSVIEAQKHNNDFVETALLLLSILRSQDSNVTKILGSHGIYYEDVSKDYIKLESTELVNRKTFTNQESIRDEKINKTDVEETIENNVELLIERAIQFDMRDTFDGVLDIENESFEIASLLSRML